MHTEPWYRRVHPAVPCFTYSGFVFFGGFWNWVLRDALPTFVAASVFSGLMLIPSLLCPAIPENRRPGLVGVYTGLMLLLVISGTYTWRAYLAFFEQANTPKGILITIQVVLGAIAFLLLFANRHYGRSTS